MKDQFFLSIMKLQTEINVPKGQYNEFGKFNYRSSEDILAALKPLLKEHQLFLNIQDSLEMIGDRFYVKALVEISDGEKKISSVAYAREPAELKGMSAPQVTGAASSYARKYALTGLLCLDDEDEVDSANNSPKTTDVSRFQKENKSAPGDYIVPGGDYAGKKISEIPKKDLTSYCLHLTDKYKNKKMDDDIKEFIDTAREYLRTAK